MCRLIAKALTSLSLVIATTSSSVATSQEPRIPAKFVTTKELQNGYSGDRRIELTTFHTLLVIDTNDRKRHNNNTLADMSALFDEINTDILADAKEVGDKVDPAFRAIAYSNIDRQPILKGDSVNKKDIDDAIAGIAERIGKLSRTAQPGHVKHVIFAWFETEGGTEHGKHYLQLYNHGNPERYDRDELRRRLEITDESGRHSRLLVFVTDACNTAVDYDLAPPAKPRTSVAVSPFGAPRPPAKVELNGWRSLYFGHQGTVDLSSSSLANPVAKAYAFRGVSVFAKTFRRGFDELQGDSIDKNKDEFIDWRNEFIPALRQEVAYQFKTLDDQSGNQHEPQELGVGESEFSVLVDR